jgi:hypothetical protein
MDAKTFTSLTAVMSRNKTSPSDAAQRIASATRVCLRFHRIHLQEPEAPVTYQPKLV